MLGVNRARVPIEKLNGSPRALDWLPPDAAEQLGAALAEGVRSGFTSSVQQPETPPPPPPPTPKRPPAWAFLAVGAVAVAVVLRLKGKI